MRKKRSECDKLRSRSGSCHGMIPRVLSSKTRLRALGIIPCHPLVVITHKRKDMNITSDNFDSTVLQASGVVVIDFWAPWCGPCKVMSPIVDELAGEVDGVTVAKVNVDDEQELARQYNILSIPTFLVFKSGQVVEQFSGSMSKEALKERIEKHVS